MILKVALEVITQDDEYTQTIDSDVQNKVFLSRTSSPDNINSCFDELADFPPSPEGMRVNNITPPHSSPSPACPLDNNIRYCDDGIAIMENQCSVDQLSSTEVDTEDFDWN